MSIKSFGVSSDSQVLVTQLQKRDGILIVNASNKPLHVAMNDVATPDNWSLVLNPFATWEVPTSFKGLLTACGSADAKGTIKVTVW